MNHKKDTFSESNASLCLIQVLVGDTIGRSLLFIVILDFVSKKNKSPIKERDKWIGYYTINYGIVFMSLPTTYS